MLKLCEGKKMRILNIITGLQMGGAENMLYKVSKEFREHDHIVHVTSLTGTGYYHSKLLEANARVSNINLKRPNPMAFRELIQSVNNYRPSIIQGWMYHGNVFAYYLKKFLNYKVPIVWNIRQSLDQYKDEAFFTKRMINHGASLSKNIDKIIYNSMYAMKQHEEVGYDSKKSIFIPNGFDLEEINKKIQEDEITREELEINENDIVFIHVGRFHPVKDHKTFILAANSFCNKYDNVKFILVGDDVTSENKLLTSLIEAKNINKIKLLGKKSNVYSYLKISNIFTSTSLGEAFSNAIGEAMALELPCVVTDVGDSKSIIEDESMVVSIQNPEAIIEKWDILYKMDKQKRLEIGKKLKNKVVMQYSIESVYQKYINLYQELL